MKINVFHRVYMAVSFSNNIAIAIHVQCDIKFIDQLAFCLKIFCKSPGKKDFKKINISHQNTTLNIILSK